VWAHVGTKTSRPPEIESLGKLRGFFVSAPPVFAPILITLQLMALTIDVLTLFPRMLDGFLAGSILGKGIVAGHLAVNVHDLRAWTTDKHRTADDRPFGGGAGMVMKPEPVFAAIEQLQTPGCRRIYLTPDGMPLSSTMAHALSREKHLILLSGHYEGIDQRIRERIIDQEISIGDYVLTNGTLAAAVVIDALARFIPGVLGEEKSLTHESFTSKLLDFPQYTRPAEFRGMSVPEVLLSGNHAEIEKWRAARQLEKTRQVRPDLLK
jgi:tRNA (guanine37-N1)-methyltransferase